MSEWRDLALGDVCELKRGYDLPHASRRDGSVPIISSSGPTGFHAEAKAEAPGVVTGRYGTLGSVFYVDEDFWPLNTALYVRDFKGNDPRYVAELLRTMNLGQYDGAAAVPGLNRNQLHTVRVRVPEPSTQQVVARVASAFDDLIENSRRRVEVLEEMARAIYREWFVKFRYPGHEDVPLVDSALGPIPEGWKSSLLGDLVSTQYGYTESASTDPVGPKYLRGMDINKTSFIDWSAVPFCPIDAADVSKFAISIGDVFVIRMADPGKVGICETEVDAVFASYLVRVRPTTNQITPYFLYFTLSDARYQAWVTGASTGATRKSVSAKVMVEPEIVVPPTRIQDAFESVVGPLRAEMTALIKTTAKLSELQGQLLPKLVSGQVDVTTLDLEAVIHGEVA